MTVAEMHNAINILLDKEDTLNYPNYKPEHKDFFLNLAQDRFVKQRYDGANAKNRGFEETQKRSDDLRNITDVASLTPLAATVDNYPNGRFVDLPNLVTNLYWFSITEQALITRKSCSNKTVKSGEIVAGQLYLVLGNSITYNGTTYNANTSFTGTTTTTGSGAVVTVTTYTGTGSVYKAVQERVDVKPMQHDDYNKIIKDPFNKPALNSGGVSELRRLQFKSRVEVLFPDNDSIFNSYIIRYIRKPQRISLSLTTDCELADHTHQEIVEMAVSSMLENIESGRYKSNLNELTKLE
jgi:hypothetical protein